MELRIIYNYIDLAECGLNSFPNGVFSLEFLWGLNIEKNNLGIVKDGKDGIGRLFNLSELNLSDCGLDEFPDITFNKKLCALFLKNNNLSSIPESVNLKDTSMYYLDLGQNNFTRIPQPIIDTIPNGCSCYISGNYIDTGSIDYSKSGQVMVDSSKQLLISSEMPEVAKMLYELGNML